MLIDFVKKVSLFALIQQLIGLKGIITLPILTKCLSTSEYGTYQLIWSGLGFAILFGILNQQVTITRFLAGERDIRHRNDSLTSSLLIVFLLSIVTIILINLFAQPIAQYFFHKDTVVPLIQITVWYVLLDSWFLVLLSYFRAREQINRYITYDFIANLTTICIVVLVIGIYRLPLSTFFVYLLIAKTVMVLVLFGKIYHELGWIGKPHLKILKSYIIFALPLMIPNLSSWIIELSDRYFIGFYHGTVNVGTYSAAYSLATLVMITQSAVSFVLLPVTSRLWNENNFDGVKFYLGTALKLNWFICLPLSVGLSILSIPILSLVTTKEIAVTGWRVVSLVSIAYLGNALANTWGLVFLLSKRTKISAYLMLGAAIINLNLNFILIPRYGIIGAAVATLAVYLILALISLFWSQKIFRFPIDGKFMLHAIFATVGMAMVILLLPTGTNFKLMVSIFCGTLMYLLLFFVLRGVKANDWVTLKSLFILRR